MPRTSEWVDLQRPEPVAGVQTIFITVKNCVSKLRMPQYRASYPGKKNYTQYTQYEY